MNGWSWFILHNFLNLLKQATRSLSKSPLSPHLVPLAKGPRLGTSSSQPKFTAWLRLGISMPNLSSSHLRLLYIPGWVALGTTQLGADLALQHRGNPRARGQLQTTLEHHHSAPAQLILHRGWRLVVSGHSQSLQLPAWVNPSH